MLWTKCLSDSSAMLLGFSAMKLVPISTYGILMNLKAMLVILIAHFYLSDPATPRKLLLVLASFVGALMIIKPGWFARAEARTPEPAAQSVFVFGCLLTCGNLLIKSFMFAYTKKHGRLRR